MSEAGIERRAGDLDAAERVVRAKGSRSSSQSANARIYSTAALVARALLLHDQGRDEEVRRVRREVTRQPQSPMISSTSSISTAIEGCCSPARGRFDEAEAAQLVSAVELADDDRINVQTRAASLGLPRRGRSLSRDAPTEAAARPRKMRSQILDAKGDVDGVPLECASALRELGIEVA